MACKNVCKLCNHLVLSTAIAFTGGNLVVTIPEGSYNNGEKYCIVLAQSIPNATTITAPVMIQIGTGTTLYPLENFYFLEKNKLERKWTSTWRFHISPVYGVEKYAYKRHFL